MWLYSLFASLLPGGKPTELPPQPSADNPTPYRYPVLDDSSQEHNPFSFTETRPVGSYLGKRAVEPEPEQQGERDRDASARIHLKTHQQPPPNMPAAFASDGTPRVNVPQPLAPPKPVMAPLDEGIVLKTPTMVETNYVKSRIKILCAETDWQLKQCGMAPGFFNICRPERRRQERCRQHTRAFLLAAGFGHPDKTPEQDDLILKECDMAFQAIVASGTSTELPIAGDEANYALNRFEKL